MPVRCSNLKTSEAADSNGIIAAKLCCCFCCAWEPKYTLAQTQSVSSSISDLELLLPSRSHYGRRIESHGWPVSYTIHTRRQTQRLQLGSESAAGNHLLHLPTGSGTSSYKILQRIYENTREKNLMYVCSSMKFNKVQKL